MSTLAPAHTTTTSDQTGNNYSVTDEIKKIITELSFKLVGRDDVSQFASLYKDALCQALSLMDGPDKEYVLYLYKFIPHVRDIIAGRGEYNLCYVLIAEWAVLLSEPHAWSGTITQQFIRNMVHHALRSLVSLEGYDHPLGSWKDIKYFINYWCVRRGWDVKTDFLTIQQDEIVQFLVNMSVEQLHHEAEDPEDAARSTLVARWIPSESSNKFGWQTKLFAMAYFPHWIETARLKAKTENISFSFSQGRGKRAMKKCLMSFRKIKSTLNKRLNTPQINQCAKTWSQINFDNDVTSITLAKQKLAFQNKKGKNGEHREETLTDSDRILCANNYMEYFERCKTGKSTAKGERVSIYDFVKAAREQTSTIDIEMTNMQWEDNSQNTSALPEMLSIINVSSSMETYNCTALYNAVGLGIRIAEKSCFGRRALTFSSVPEWVVYEDEDSFTDMVNRTLSSTTNGNSNIASAFRMILRIAVENNLGPEQMVKTLVILSDMQIDNNSFAQEDGRNYTPVLADQIEHEFRNSCCEAAPNGYEMPVVVFWNLEQTQIFPSCTHKKNVYMVSGYSPTLINLFSEYGLSALENITPYRGVLQSLSHPRYDSFERCFAEG
jgi:hypothetical protein